MRCGVILAGNGMNAEGWSLLLTALIAQRAMYGAGHTWEITRTITKI